jgi:hypothetical protein
MVNNYDSLAPMFFHPLHGHLHGNLPDNAHESKE